MNLKKNQKIESRPINLVLLAVSFIIFGSLGIVFITQMELQPGWVWEGIRDTYPVNTYILETEDITQDGHNEIIGYADLRGYDAEERIISREYGGIYCWDGSNGQVLWKREYNEPIKKVFPIMDIDGDGIKEYFVCKASVPPDWIEIVDIEGRKHYNPTFDPNLCTNQLIYGHNGSILNDYGFPNLYVHDLINIDFIPDSNRDFILLECKKFDITYGNETFPEYRWKITTYYINGTIKESINNTYNGHFQTYDELPKLELFHHTDLSHLLFISRESLVLLNLSSNNFFDTIYNVTFPSELANYEFIEDLDNDGILEILTVSYNGSVYLINGYDGNIIRRFTIPENGGVLLDELHTPENDGVSYVFFNIRYHDNDGEDRYWRIYSIESSSENIIWEKPPVFNTNNFEDDVFVLHDDIDGDYIDDLILYEQYTPSIGFNDVNRFTVSNMDGAKFAILNLDVNARSIITINDINNDGKKDFAFTNDGRFLAISTSKPWGLWQSSAFPLGFPLFIILVALVIIGLIIVILKGKKLKYRRQGIREHKLTLTVNILAIILMTITFLLFLIMMNIFNSTLLPNSNNSTIIIAFILVSIIWYGTLPLTAALYNRFAPQFAYIFIKLRHIFFKISKDYKTDIIVLDMKERKDIGLIIQLKRLILPLLLSIAVGFYAYDILTPIFGYRRDFDVFGGAQFFSFMIGYMICCVLPIILSFALFSFFISGNYLLDDAGIVYYREHKRYRQPGDIEPISIWAQSIIKGVAGFSALITFSTFLLKVDFSGFFTTEEIGFTIFGIFIVIVMFGGIPFLTGFSYVLLAGEVMEMCAEYNIQKLYKIMDKKGYNTTKREITNLYPSGYEASKNESENVEPP